ncbi:MULTISPECIES: hypothetical protein [Pseudomonas]|uniref:hypothetical protein n=1 Tax=Pseudomonas TaxID=286 RepID=UPI000FC43680|nr:MULTISPECIES: hypothetical protein [Pseudomonas]MCZ2339877.1 hypothetical protein [Chitinophagales bacterium]RUE17048.1 hypothetical protein IPC1222_25390 [Pseudomonas aeruginosa]CAH0135519.1 hypothetical protein SRABI111_00327 [Pseudomonas carnis]CAH0138502.1 hypothetical protein SRABI110_00471 [Pseudomonas carnis]CAH0158617.1 hypothetical protein SRABI64_00721 [Pseudomonas carnis]
MSDFYAQFKHKLVEAKSPDYQMIMTNDEFLSSCASAAMAMVKDSGFKLVGFADLAAKKYFIISKLGRDGDLIEIPISTVILDMWHKSYSADIQKQRMKKALKREDFQKFSLEMARFADARMAELEMKFPC